MAEQWAAGKPIVGFEQDLGSDTPLPDHGGRRNRFFRVYQQRGGGNSVNTPMFMIDAGRDIKSGDLGLNDEDKMRRVFDSWFAEALARPALARLDAWWERKGASSVMLQVDITNISDAAFDPFEDDSAIVVIIYDEKPDVSYEGTVRWAKQIPLDEVIQPDALLRQDILLDDVSGVNFRDLKVVVMLEHRPFNDFDVAQAAFAVEGAREPVDPIAITITAPPNGTRVEAGEEVLLEAEVAGGTTAKVAYYAGDAFLGEAESAPWQLAWSEQNPGTYRITAEAEIGGRVYVSEPIEVEVVATLEPTPEPTAGPTAEPTRVGPPTAVPTVDMGDDVRIFLPLALKDVGLR